MESESPFVFPDFPDSDISPSSLPQALHPDGMRMERVCKARKELVQEQRLAFLQFDEEQRLAFLQFDEEQRLAFSQFDEEHRFPQLQQEFEELNTLVQTYKRPIVSNFRSE